MDVRSFYGKRRPAMRRRVVRARIRPAGARLTKRTRKTVASIAKRVFNRKVETKYAGVDMPSSYSPNPFQAIYGAVLPTGGVGQLFTCVPQITQGDTTFERQGNKINPTRHTTDLRFVFNEDAALQYTPSGGSPTNYPIAQAGWDITVHVWYGFAKRFKRVSEIAGVANTTNILQTMLQDGQGNSQEWNGLLTDELLDIDREVVTMKHKKFRMYKNAGLANVGDPISPSLTTPMSTAHSLHINWKPPKTLLYGEDSSLVPENYAPFIVIGYCHNDGTPASNTGNSGATSDLSRIPAIKFFKADKLYYKDA